MAMPSLHMGKSESLTENARSMLEEMVIMIMIMTVVAMMIDDHVDDNDKKAEEEKMGSWRTHS